MRIKYVDLGLANFYGDYVEINRKLKDNKKLRDYIVKHELGHKKGFDLKHEFDFTKQTFMLFLFIIKNPKTWIDFLPIQIRKKQLIYDLNMIILYAFSFILFGILILIIK